MIQISHRTVRGHSEQGRDPTTMHEEILAATPAIGLQGDRNIPIQAGDSPCHRAIHTTIGVTRESEQSSLCRPRHNLDLLFYHLELRAFVVIDLKIGTFKVEHVGKMNFYLNAVDQQLRQAEDRDSVGIILCTNRNEPVAKLALHRIHAPIAVSTWQTDRPTADLRAGEDGHTPTDSGELTQLDEIRAQLADRVARHLPDA